jgi:malonyl-CoA O-methyltransferase
MRRGHAVARAPHARDETPRVKASDDAIDPIDGHGDALIDAEEAYALWAPEYPPVAHTPLMRVEERTMWRAIPDVYGLTVLDVGCGTGRYLRLARTRGARTIVGVDASRAMLDRVPVQDVGAGQLVEVVQGRVEAMPIRNEFADVAICALTLGHASSLDAAFAELARVTRRGGRLICSELHPVGASLGWRRTFTRNGRRYAVRHAAHSVDEWLAAGRAAGWVLQQQFEPRLESNDIPAGSTVDARALTVPAALVMCFARPRGASV